MVYLTQPKSESTDAVARPGIADKKPIGIPLGDARFQCVCVCACVQIKLGTGSLVWICVACNVKRYAHRFSSTVVLVVV